jgi:hypothetical protein
MRQKKNVIKQTPNNLLSTPAKDTPKSKAHAMHRVLDLFCKFKDNSSELLMFIIKNNINKFC